MSTLIIQYLLTAMVPTRRPVIYLFCEYDRENEQTLAHFTASLLRQLASQSGQVFHAIEQLHSQWKTENVRPSLQNLQTHLEAAFRSFTAVSVIVDALDECKPIIRGELISMIHRMSQYNIHLLATSRGAENVRALFTDSLILEIKASWEDIELYVRSRLTGSTILVNQHNTNLTSDVVQGVADAVEGM
jgi:hypothetical protein